MSSQDTAVVMPKDVSPPSFPSYCEPFRITDGAQHFSTQGMSVLRRDIPTGLSLFNQSTCLSVHTQENGFGHSHEFENLGRKYPLKEPRISERHETHIARGIEQRDSALGLMIDELYITEPLLFGQPFQVLLFGPLTDKSKENNQVAP